MSEFSDGTKITKVLCNNTVWHDKDPFSLTFHVTFSKLYNKTQYNLKIYIYLSYIRHITRILFLYNVSRFTQPIYTWTILLINLNFCWIFVTFVWFDLCWSKSPPCFLFLDASLPVCPTVCLSFRRPYVRSSVQPSVCLSVKLLMNIDNWKGVSVRGAEFHESTGWHRGLTFYDLRS